jgi:hypothetical protein
MLTACYIARGAGPKARPWARGPAVAQGMWIAQYPPKRACVGQPLPPERFSSGFCRRAAAR